jgi:hypothetical protein
MTLLLASDEFVIPEDPGCRRRHQHVMACSRPSPLSAAQQATLPDPMTLERPAARYSAAPPGSRAGRTPPRVSDVGLQPERRSIRQCPDAGHGRC